MKVVRHVLYLNRNQINSHIGYLLSLYPRIAVLYQNGRMGDVDYIIGYAMTSLPMLIAEDQHALDYLFNDLIEGVSLDEGGDLGIDDIQALYTFLTQLAKDIIAIILPYTPELIGSLIHSSLDEVDLGSPHLIVCKYV